MQNKTFRLFVSSTFNDFREERKTLQSIVFPLIKQFCSKKGYSFQPIDLRWGISQEAQLDQKTLEICLNEVRSCKTYTHPNFLVLLGDRYGWVPLPYQIEQDEFEKILQKGAVKEQSKLLEWYQLDLNQIPASYILKERSKEYTNFSIWGKIEKELLQILQKKSKVSLTKKQQKKYFTSATEAEIIEGIIPYEYITAFQNKIISNNPKLKKIDADYIFGFVRNIDFKDQKPPVFIGPNYNKAIETKKKLKSVLPKNNIFEINTNLLNEKEVNTNYLEDFSNKIIEFLKQKINQQIIADEQISDLEKEILEQKYFAEQKRKIFIGQEVILNQIQDYLQNNNQQSLIVYGKSGSGKSSIMAKAIEQIEEKSNSKIIYRFVGATAQTSNSKSLLVSIFKELEITIESEEKTLQDKETFEEFSERVKNYFYEIKQEVIIFIDAIDQINSEDNFLWLPEILPVNVKVIITALKDENYNEDSQYFRDLSIISNNTIEVQAFKNAEELLLSLLENENRTVQKHQIGYFLEQYKTVKTPLFVYVVSQEMKNWKSFDNIKGQSKTKGRIQQLANTQKGIIKEFLQNLATIYHHDIDFVNKILGYIYASKDGLSESEILKLLSTDKKFIQKIAPETFHQNINKELPIVIWVRLYNQLKPFLSTKNQDNEKLLFFFHREFVDVIGNTIVIKKEFYSLFIAIQKLIKKYQNDDFYTNRWGRIYAQSLKEFYTHFTIRKNSKLYSFFLKIKQPYTEVFTQWTLNQWNEFTNANKSYLYISYYISKLLYTQNKDLWAEAYSFSLNDLAFSLSLVNKTKQSLEFEKEALKIREYYIQNGKKWLEEYTTSLLNISDTYSSLNKVDVAIEYAEKALRITEGNYTKNKEEWIENYNISLTHLSAYYKKYNDIETALAYSIKAHKIILTYYKKDPQRWQHHYYVTLRDLADLYYANNDLKKALKLNKDSLLIIETLYLKNNNKWAKQYINGLNQIAVTYQELRQLTKSVDYETKAFTIVETLYNNNPLLWQKEYFRIINNLNINNPNVNTLEKLFEIKIILKKRYKQQPEIWLKLYINTLNNIAFYYLDNSIELNKALRLFTDVHTIVKDAYNTNKEVYLEEYLVSINNLSSYFLEVHKTKKAVELSEEAFQIVKLLYQKNVNRWGKDYVLFLSNLSYTYSLDGQHKKALFLEEQNNKLTKKLYHKDNILWNGDYIKSLFNIAFLYKEDLQIEKALLNEKEALKILHPLYRKDHLSWNKEMITVFNNIAYSYRLLQNIKQAKYYNKKALELLEKLFKNNPNFWIENYVTALNNYADLLSKPALKLLYYQKAFTIIEKAYKTNTTFWMEIYASSLRNLAIAYKEVGDFDKAIVLEKKALVIHKKVFLENPDKWIDDYSTTLNNLSYSYHLAKKYNKAIIYDKEVLQLIKPYFDEAPQVWLDAYITVLNNLSITYRHLGNYQLSENYLLTALPIIASYYKKNSIWKENYVLSLENLLALYQITATNKAMDITHKLKMLYNK